jgi:hypothetical protein
MAVTIPTTSEDNFHNKLKTVKKKIKLSTTMAIEKRKSNTNQPKTDDQVHSYELQQWYTMTIHLDLLQYSQTFGLLFHTQITVYKDERLFYRYQILEQPQNF